LLKKAIANPRSPISPSTWGRFFVHFFRGKSLSAENSAEFLGKTIFQNFFRGKFNFSPTFFFFLGGGNFPRNFPKISPEKNVRKIVHLKAVDAQVGVRATEVADGNADALSGTSLDADLQIRQKLGDIIFFRRML
jgi:hypothetical protein